MSTIFRKLNLLIVGLAILTLLSATAPSKSMANSRPMSNAASCRGTNKVIYRWWGVEAWLDSCATEDSIRAYENTRGVAPICTQLVKVYWVLKAACSIPFAYANLPKYGFLARLKSAYSNSYQRRGVILFQPWAGPGYFAPQ